MLSDLPPYHLPHFGGLEHIDMRLMQFNTLPQRVDDAYHDRLLFLDTNLAFVSSNVIFLALVRQHTSDTVELLVDLVLVKTPLGIGDKIEEGVGALRSPGEGAAPGEENLGRRKA